MREVILYGLAAVGALTLAVTAAVILFVFLPARRLDRLEQRHRRAYLARGAR